MKFDIGKYMLVAIALMLIYSPNLDSSATLNQNETRSVEICKPSSNCITDESVRKFESLDEAIAYLNDFGGGRVLMQPGLYQTTQILSGQWTFLGQGFPESVAIIANETQDQRFVFSESVSTFTVLEGASLHLENITLENDRVLSIGTVPFEQAWGVTIENGGRLTGKNLIFRDWQARALHVRPDASVDIQFSTFDCPSWVKGNRGDTIYVEGQSNFHANKFMNCEIASVFGEGASTFDSNEFLHSHLNSLNKLILTNNHFMGVYTRIPDDELGASRLVSRSQVSIGNESQIINNTFEMPPSGSGLKFGLGVASLVSLPNVRGNVFRGLRIGLAVSGFGPGELRIEDNRFEDNELGVEFSGPGLVTANGNSFAGQQTCGLLIRTFVDETELEGVNNTFSNNQGDICPDELTIPNGFIAESTN